MDQVVPILVAVLSTSQSPQVVLYTKGDVAVIAAWKQLHTTRATVISGALMPFCTPNTNPKLNINPINTELLISSNGLQSIP